MCLVPLFLGLFLFLSNLFFHKLGDGSAAVNAARDRERSANMEKGKKEQKAKMRQSSDQFKKAQHLFKNKVQSLPLPLLAAISTGLSMHAELVSIWQ